MRPLLICLLLLMTGCATSPFAGIVSPPSEPKKLAAYSQTEKQIPLKIGVSADGRDVIAYATERSYSANSSETPEKLSFMQRLGRWLGGLTLISVLIGLGLLAAGITWPFIAIARRYYTAKNTLKKVVEGVEELNAQEQQAQQLKNSLSMKMDTNEKTLIKKLRTEI